MCLVTYLHEVPVVGLKLAMQFDQETLGIC
jgi:hypothetical protein